MAIKFLQLPFILLIVVSCVHSPKRELNVDSIIRDGDAFFEEDIYNSYVENGKYYLVKCNSWLSKATYAERDTESVFEIKVGDIVLGRPDDHSSIFYTVEKLKDNTIQFGYESSFDHRSFGVNKRSTNKGSFVIHCSGKKEFVRLIVDGLEVSAASAKKHIAKGKFYILLKFNNKRGESGNGVSNRNDYCNKAMFDKFGYYQYILDQCVPNKFYKQQINAYNTVVFNYLKAKKGFTFNDYEDMENDYYLEHQECHREKNKKNKQ